MWKYLLIWGINAAFAVIASAAEVQSTSASGDTIIKASYDWASTIATLTDRGLWLFFLGIILFGAWLNDTRKEKELKEYRVRDTQLIAALAANNDRLAESNKLMERIERWLDDH